MFKTGERLGRAYDYRGSFPNCRKREMVNIFPNQSTDVMNYAYQLERIHLESNEMINEVYKIH